MSQERCKSSLWARCETCAAVFYFGLCLLFLGIVAGLTHRLRHPEVTPLEISIMKWSLIVTWPIFLADGAIRLWLCYGTQRWRTCLGAVAAMVLFPPLRLGARGYIRGDYIWLPVAGWRVVDKALCRDLERFFSVPMIVIAALVVPLLVIEYGWSHVRSIPALALALDIGSAAIWFAFAVEFALMISVTPHKLQYCLRNWVDVLIVALPLFEAMPALRLLRVLWLQQLTRMGSAYRLRALVMKAWRAFLVLDLVQRLGGLHPAKTIAPTPRVAASQTGRDRGLAQGDCCSGANDHGSGDRCG
ncbi:MAG: hypothetical protein C4296_04330 [Gemmataceae bacterium]